MSLSVFFEVGRSWGGGLLRAVSDAWRGAFRTNSGSGGAAPAPVLRTVIPDAAVESLRTAGEALRSAFTELGTRTRPIYTTTLYTGASIAATTSGLVTRINPLVGGSSVLRTTEAINVQTPARRQSWDTVGLDVVSAASQLDSAALGLDVSSPEVASSTQSTGELNSGIDTSYGTSSLTFSLGGTTSSSVGTLTGTYTGTGQAANATSLEVEITRGDRIGTGLLGLGEGDIDFRVKDQNGTVLFTYSGSLAADEEVYLGADIGLTISFSAGQLKNNHSASTTVTKTPITVDGDAAFNAAPASRPRFEGGAVVTAGSFTVNGATIAVAANDTIHTVLSKINDSAAGVTASLADDRITLTTDGPSEDDIVIAGDTSGFVAATKLAAASTTIGNVRDDEQVFAKTSQFAGISSGSFTINGVAISVDRDADSLSTLIDRINAAGAGVIASYDAGTDRIELVSVSPSESSIAVEHDTTGFLAVAGLATGNTVTGNIADDEQLLAELAPFAAVVAGTFEINGVSIAFDPAVDTLQSVLSRINASAADVTAAYDDAADVVVITSNDLETTLSIANDTSGFLDAVDLATGVFAPVDADAAFNAAAPNDPRFEPGTSVVAGSFTVNGVSIAVAADDSINSVLAKITASAAGVTATYDQATQTITLTENLADGTPIVLADDTSGFLAAVKLDATAQSTTPGAGVSAFDATLDQMSEYSSVGAGTVTVNGQAIAVDPSTTTISGFVSALNALPDVWAEVDEATGRLTIRSIPGGSIEVADTSGLLAELGIADGTYAGTVGTTTALETQTGTVATNTPDVVARVRSAVDDVTRALEQIAGARPHDTALHRDLIDAARDLVSSLDRLGVAGFAVATDGSAPGLAVDSKALGESLDAMARPAEARLPVGTAVDAFTERAARLAQSAAEQAKAAAASAPLRMVTPLSVIDLSSARSTMSRPPARTSAYRSDGPPTILEGLTPAARPSELSPSVAPPASQQEQPPPGVFQGLFDGMLVGD